MEVEQSNDVAERLGGILRFGLIPVVLCWIHSLRESSLAVLLGLVCIAAGMSRHVCYEFQMCYFDLYYHRVLDRTSCVLVLAYILISHPPPLERVQLCRRTIALAVLGVYFITRVIFR